MILLTVIGASVIFCFATTVMCLVATWQAFSPVGRILFIVGYAILFAWATYSLFEFGPQLLML